MKWFDKGRPADMPYGDNGFSPVYVPRIDQSHELSDGSVSPCLGYQCAQLFSTGLSGVLRYVELQIEVLASESCSARVGIYGTVSGLPSANPADIVGYSELAGPLVSGWNAFSFRGEPIALTSGRTYAIVLEPTSLCDWRAELQGHVPADKPLCHRWGMEEWQVIRPAACAVFRTYIEGFRSSTFPSWK